MDLSRTRRLIIQSLSRFHSIPKILKLADFLFSHHQLGTAEALKDHIEKSKDNLKIFSAHKFILDRLMEEWKTRDKKEEDILCTMDLAYLIVFVNDDKESGKKLSLKKFDLTGFDPDDVSQINCSEISTVLKRLLPPSHEKTLIQSKIESSSGPNYLPRVFLSLSLAKEGEEGRKTMFVTFVAGESHFFCNQTKPDQMVCKALCHFLQCLGFEPSQERSEQDYTVVGSSKHAAHDPKQPSQETSKHTKCVEDIGKQETNNPRQRESTEISSLVNKDLEPVSKSNNTESMKQSNPIKKCYVLMSPIDKLALAQRGIKISNSDKEDEEQNDEDEIVLDDSSINKLSFSLVNNNNNNSMDNQSNLSWHVKAVQFGTKDKKCPECDYKSAKQYLLNKHLKRSHNSVKDKKCPDCDYSSREQFRMTKHIRAVHRGIKDHKCGKCSEEYKDGCALREHIKREHSDRQM